MPQAALGQLQLNTRNGLKYKNPSLVSMPQAALGQLQLLNENELFAIIVSMPQAALGQLQLYPAGSPAVSGLAGRIWREIQKTAIHTILEHVHQSEKASIQS